MHEKNTQIRVGTYRDKYILVLITLYCLYKIDR